MLTPYTTYPYVCDTLFSCNFSCDQTVTSGEGLGAILAQKQEDGSVMQIAFASQSRFSRHGALIPRTAEVGFRPTGTSY